MQTEFWYDFPLELKLNKYQISNLHNIKNKRTGRVLKPSIRKGEGYPYVCLSHDDNNSKTHYVHRLVALTFISNPENKPTVNHMNHIRHDYNISNLEWATMKEQNIHKKSIEVFHTRKVRQSTISGEMIKIWDSVKEVHAVFPYFFEYMAGRTFDINYIFQYEDMILLEGEIFLEIMLDSYILAVSNRGRICNNNSTTFGASNAKGYKIFNLGDKKINVHRAVALAFVPRPEHLKDVPYENLEVNHQDGVKYNNIPENLNWCTHSENMIHSRYVLGNIINHPVIQYSKDGVKLNEFTSGALAAKTLGKQSSHIHKCCRGERNVAYGFVWKYKNEIL